MRAVIVPSLLSIAGLIGCASTHETAVDMTQIGSRAVAAKGTRVETKPLDWKQVEDRLAEYGLGGAAGVI